MGSCKNDYCCEVTAESIISELDEFNTSPGVARCADSCSAWWCGCPVSPTVAPFVTGCLFYRYYALPTSNTTYEVFSCPTWEQHIVARISLKIANDSRAVNATLHPGMTFHWDEFSVTPLSVSQAPTPVLSQKFITDGTTLRWLESWLVILIAKRVRQQTILHAYYNHQHASIASRTNPRWPSTANVGILSSKTSFATR